MMAQNAVAAREGAMKDYAEYCRCYLWMWYYIVCALFPSRWKGSPKQTKTDSIPRHHGLDPWSSLL